MTAHSRFVLGLLAVTGCAPEPAFDVRETVGQLYVTHAPAGATIEALRDGKVVASGTVDELGSLVLRRLAPGPNYVVKVQGSKEQTRPLTVKSVESSKPAQDFYSKQTLKAGFNYLTMRF